MLTVALLAFLAGRATRQQAPEVITEVRDTLYLRDTLIAEVAAAPCYIYRTEEVVIPVHDTIVARDTIYAAVERTTLRYEDSTYTAIVSGIYPRLDSLAIYPRKEVVTIHTTERVTVPKANRWGLGLQAGYGGVLADGKLATGPYIGVGISWNLATW
jgi:hypothetical protein